MPLQVIGAGFGRTGTSSLKRALEQLGCGPCYHMRELWEHQEGIPFFEEAAQTRQTDWDQLFSGWQAAVDYPASSFWRELMEHYPKSKVILSTRDPDSWWESTSKTIYRASRGAEVVDGPDPRDRIHRTLKTIAWQGWFHGRFEDKDYAVKRFVDHEALVKATVPPERLLVWNASEGWEPLCAFLDVVVPSTPFPYENDRQTFIARMAENNVT